jgi:glycosyltransferase involved in cell wall biosynthesis
MTFHTLLYFQQNPVFGAAENYIYDLAAGVDPKTLHVHLLCSEDSALDPFEELKARGVAVHRAPPFWFAATAIRAVPPLCGFLRALRPDIVHFNDPCINGILGAWAARIPFSVMTHHTPELERRYSAIGRLFERLALSTHPRIIFTSEYSRQLGVEKGISRKDGVVIPLGLRPEWFTALDVEARKRIRAELGISDDQFVVLNAARLSAQKRQDCLLESCRIVRAQNERVLFLVAGEGELRPVLERAIQKAELQRYFRLLGHRENMPEIFDAADVLVMSSDFEGLCYATLEAAARGLPVIATNVGGMRFSVDDGKTGVLVPPRNANALARQIERLAADPNLRRAMGKAGRERAERLFTCAQMVADTEAFYRSLVCDRRGKHEGSR